MTASLQCHDLGGAHKVDGVAVAAQCGHGVDVTAAGVISSETSASRLDGFTRERSSTLTIPCIVPATAEPTSALVVLGQREQREWFATK